MGMPRFQFLTLQIGLQEKSISTAGIVGGVVSVSQEKGSSPGEAKPLLLDQVPKEVVFLAVSVGGGCISRNRMQRIS
jgi:hypothetical protein